MTPLVYLYEQQLNELRVNQDNHQSAKGFFFSWDDDTVFHVQHFPKTEALSNTCTFLFVPDGQLDSSPETLLKEITVEQNASKPHLFVFYSNQKLSFRVFLYKNNEFRECAVRFIPEKSDLYSRNKGILESGALEKKSVGIVGLGSGGSLIAIELAKAGIGSFTLIDFDRLELSNIARHVCGIHELGRMKTNAMRDAILQKNPYAQVNKLDADITVEREASEKALAQTDLIIAASDNDRSRFFLNEIALRHKIPALFGRALTRASGGDVMRVRPFEGPCYSCLYSQKVRAAGSDDEEISQKRQAKVLLPGYTSEQEMHSVIQVGLASDIAPIANMMVKLALVELSKGIDSGIRSLEDDFAADFYIWANRRENVYENWHKLEFNFNQPTILRWYGARVQRDPLCMVCG